MLQYFDVQNGICAQNWHLVLHNLTLELHKIFLVQIALDIPYFQQSLKQKK